MNVKALQCFIKVYEKKSINAAAKEVYMSPQGLSKVIKQLEIDLEAELFSRGAQGMEATESGELLYARARHVCYLMEDIKKEISIINGSKGTLNVVVTYSTSTVLPFDFIFGFSTIYPNIQIKLKEYPDEYPIADLFEEEADIGLIIGHEGIKNCKYELMVPGELVAIVSQKHPLAQKSQISLKDLEKEPLVLKATEEDKEHQVMEKFLEYGMRPKVFYESGNLVTLHKLCEDYLSVGISVDFIEEFFRNEKLKILRLKEKLPENIYMITRNREIQNKAIALFQEYLTDAFKKQKPRRSFSTWEQ